jgi:hypothetical protein
VASLAVVAGILAVAVLASVVFRRGDAPDGAGHEIAHKPLLTGEID